MIETYNNVLRPVDTADSQAILQDTPNQIDIDHTE